MSEIAFLGLAEAAGRIRAKQLSPVEYTKALLTHVERNDAALNCFIALTPERALKSAREAETEIMAGRWRGMLHGVPYALKDIIDVAGLKTTAHSRILIDNVAAQDAPVAARLAAAGGILLGKLATHEFAIGGPSFDLPWPPARNPWNRDCMPGGSSTGAAAGLAAGFFPATLGSDTGGSIRNPASFCGVTGMKPTYGRVSRRGVMPLAYSLDHVGPMTRNVRDNAILLQAIAGHDAKDPGSADVPVPDYAAELDCGVKGLRIGIIRHFHAKDIERGTPEQMAALETAERLLAGQGARISETTLPPLADLTACGQIILAAEAYGVHETWLRQRPQDYGARGRERLLAGATITAAEYLRASRWRRTLCEQVAAAFKDIDVALTATSVDPAPRFDDDAALAAIFGRQVLMPFNVTGQPAISVPAGFTGQGMPLSVQFIGHPFAEATVYRVARAYEVAAALPVRRPPGLAA